MKRTKRVTLILMFSLALFLGAPGVARWEYALGQSKGKQGLSNGRNPFLFPSGGRSPAKETFLPPPQKKEASPEVKPVEVPLPSFKVKAILIGEHIRLASIDRKIVTVGDTIQGERVLEIKPDQVILERGDRKRSLFLSQSPYRLNVEEGSKGERP
jgi:hypothetical protein